MNEQQVWLERLAPYSFVGNLTGWRKMKNNTRRDKILQGYNKLYRILCK